MSPQQFREIAWNGLWKQNTGLAQLLGLDIQLGIQGQHALVGFFEFGAQGVALFTQPRDQRLRLGVGKGRGISHLGSPGQQPAR